MSRDNGSGKDLARAARRLRQIGSSVDGRVLAQARWARSDRAELGIAVAAAYALMLAIAAQEPRDKV